MKVQETHKVVFRITGPDYDDGFPLLESVRALQEFQNIIDKAYMSLSGVSRISYQERRQFVVIATRFNRGSLAVDMQLAVLAAVQSVKMGAIKQGDLWKIVKYGYDFFKLMFKFKEKGVTPMIDNDGNNNVFLFANNTAR